MADYNGSLKVMSGMKPEGNIPVASANDIWVRSTGTALSSFDSLADVLQEVDAGIDAAQSSVNKITDGTVSVPKADNATNADVLGTTEFACGRVENGYRTLQLDENFLYIAYIYDEYGELLAHALLPVGNTTHQTTYNSTHAHSTPNGDCYVVSYLCKSKQVRLQVLNRGSDNYTSADGCYVRFMKLGNYPAPLL